MSWEENGQTGFIGALTAGKPFLLAASWKPHAYSLACGLRVWLLFSGHDIRTLTFKQRFQRSLRQRSQALTPHTGRGLLCRHRPRAAGTGRPGVRCVVGALASASPGLFYILVTIKPSSAYVATQRSALPGSSLCTRHKGACPPATEGPPRCTTGLGPPPLTDEESRRRGHTATGSSNGNRNL